MSVQSPPGNPFDAHVDDKTLGGRERANTQSNNLGVWSQRSGELRRGEQEEQGRILEGSRRE